MTLLFQISERSHQQWKYSLRAFRDIVNEEFEVSMNTSKFIHGLYCQSGDNLAVRGLRCNILSNGRPRPDLAGRCCFELAGARKAGPQQHLVGLLAPHTDAGPMTQRVESHGEKSSALGPSNKIGGRLLLVG